MPGDPRPIGVFNSGMGGLTVLRALVAELPHERFVYLGDTRGCLTAPRARRRCRPMRSRRPACCTTSGVKMLVIACNTASAVALYLPARGVGADPGDRRDRAGRAGRRGGDPQSPHRRDRHRGHGQGRGLCPRHSTADERGGRWCSSPARCSWRWPRKAGPIHRPPTPPPAVLGTLFTSPRAPDTLVLGCTHFPVLADAIREHRRGRGAGQFGETTAVAVAEALAGAARPARPATGRYASSPPIAPERFARVGAIFLGRAIDPDSVELVDLWPGSYPFGGGSLSGNAADSSVGSVCESGRRLRIGGDGHLPQQALQPRLPEQDEDHQAIDGVPTTRSRASMVSSRKWAMPARARSRP